MKKLEKEKRREATPETGDDESVASEKGGDPVLEYLQKRIRNLQKRKGKLDKYQELLDLGDAKSLNADQVSALKSREAVDAPLKDLEETLGQYNKHLAAAKQEKEREAIEQEKEVQKRLEQAKQEGIAIGTEKLSLLVKFLRAASFKRQFSDKVSAEESSGLETLLQVVYGGDEVSLAAIEKLYNGEEEPVTEDSIKYSEIKEIALTPVEKWFGNDEEEEEAEDQKEEESKAVSSGIEISFLQEEEPEEEEPQPQPQDEVEKSQQPEPKAPEEEQQPQPKAPEQEQPEQGQAKQAKATEQKKEDEAPKSETKKPRRNRRKGQQAKRANGHHQPQTEQTAA
ncbi:hypothetical protein TRVA0_020S02080 [Trichomonascus vanleenenianus]|uniref:uncharacterized protein n=1 Tax=Trichomonascus vanleenenianus TaxID=2268995 RepID=UPI003ECB8888